MLDFTLVDTASHHACFGVDARLRNRSLDLGRRRHDRIVTLGHAGLELRMREDEEVVVHYTVEHALARFERIHADWRAWPRRLAIAELRGLRGPERILFAHRIVVRVHETRAEHRRADARA